MIIVAMLFVRLVIEKTLDIFYFERPLHKIMQKGVTVTLHVRKCLKPLM